MTLGTMDNVKVFDAGVKGRGLKATRDLLAGDVVFAEPSFSAVVFDSLSTSVCHNCFRQRANLHRCVQCKFAHYCDRTCQTACWNEHKKECAAIRAAAGSAPSENVRLAARMLWRIQKETGVVSDGQLTSVDELMDHVSDLTDEDREELQVDVHNFMDFWPKNPRKPQPVEYISHIFGIIKCNAFTLSDQRGLQAVGVGLFPNLCMVNHDCWPNCTVILNHGNQSALDSALHSKRRIELRALEKVAEGVELTVSYVDFLNLSAERQRILKKQYHFNCTCQHCTEHIKDDLMMAVKEGGENKPTAELIKQVTTSSEACLEKVAKCRLQGDFHGIARLCGECLTAQENVLADTHLYKLRLQSTASEVLSYMHAFAEAAQYSRKTIDGYMALYHPTNAQLGMAIMRAGVTHWHAGQIEAGHELICKAYGILLITHGPNHPITRDLESMRSQTEMELKMFQQNEEVYRTMREAALKKQPAKGIAENTEEKIEDVSRKQ